MRVVVSDTRLS